MIFTVVIWLYIFIVSTAWGLVFFHGIKRINPISIESIPVYLLSLTGLALICCFLSIFSIVYKIGFAANMMVLFLSLLFILFCRRQVSGYLSKIKNMIRSIPLITAILLTLGMLIILFETVAEVKIYDTGLYHAQAIQWMNEYGVVPGLGNLHQRFAFNNHNFLLEALFNLKFLTGQTFHVVNGYVSFLFTITMLYYMWGDIKKLKISAVIYLLMLSIPLFFYRKFISSPSPDILVALVTIFIFIVYYHWHQHFFITFLTILVLSLWLVTIKVSSIPIILLPAIYFLQHLKQVNKQVWLGSVALVILFIIPYLVRNVIISGYLLYPFSHLDLFNFDWKIPKEYVDQMNVIVKGWARTKEWSIDKSFIQWLPIWFHTQTLFNKLSVLISLLAPVMIMIVSLFTGMKQKITNEERILALVLWISVLFWLTSAPDLRFIFHIQVFIWTLLFILLAKQLQTFKLDSKFILSFGLPCLLTIFFLVILIQDFSLKSIKKNTWVQVPYPSPRTISLTQYQVPINSPEDNELCWDTCLPCSIIQDKIGISPFIAQRGATLASGFRTTIK